MKRAKKHRKRHILPGPCGLRQQRKLTLHNTGNESEDECDEHEHGEQNEPRKIQRTTPKMIHEHVQVWDSACVSLQRILPSVGCSGVLASADTHRNTSRMSPSLIRRALSHEYTLLSDLPYSNSLIIPKILVQITMIHSHGHCDYTVELMDESVMKPESGWLGQSLISNHPEWIKPGTVFLCQNISMAVFRRDNGNGWNANLSHNDNAADHGIANAVNGNGIDYFERMLVLGEENIVYAWTSKSVTEVDNDQYLQLLEKRADVEETLRDAVTVEEDDDQEYDHEDDDEHDLTSEHEQYKETVIGEKYKEHGAKDNANDWSDIPVSSTMENGTQNETVVIDGGRVGNRAGNANITVTAEIGTSNHVVSTNLSASQDATVSTQVQPPGSTEPINDTTRVAEGQLSATLTNPYISSSRDKRLHSINQGTQHNESSSSSPKAVTPADRGRHTQMRPPQPARVNASAIRNPYLKSVSQLSQRKDNRIGVGSGTISHKTSLQSSTNTGGQSPTPIMDKNTSDASDMPSVTPCEADKNANANIVHVAASPREAVPNPYQKRSNDSSYVRSDTVNTRNNAQVNVDLTRHQSNRLHSLNNNGHNDPRSTSRISTSESPPGLNPQPNTDASFESSAIKQNTQNTSFSSPSIWNSIQNNVTDIQAFDEGHELVSSTETYMPRSDANHPTPISTTQAEENAHTDGGAIKSASLFSNLDNLDENELDAFLEDDDE